MCWGNSFLGIHSPTSSESPFYSFMMLTAINTTLNIYGWYLLLLKICREEGLVPRPPLDLLTELTTTVYVGWQLPTGSGAHWLGPPSLPVGPQFLCWIQLPAYFTETQCQRVPNLVLCQFDLLLHSRKVIKYYIWTRSTAKCFLPKRLRMLGYRYTQARQLPKQKSVINMEAGQTTVQGNKGCGWFYTEMASQISFHPHPIFKKPTLEIVESTSWVRGIRKVGPKLELSDPHFKNGLFPSIKRLVKTWMDTPLLKMKTSVQKVKVMRR